jgi:hypothetical protein
MLPMVGIAAQHLDRSVMAVEFFADIGAAGSVSHRAYPATLQERPGPVNLDGIVKSKTTKLRIAKTACYEARNVVLVAFYENDNLSGFAGQRAEEKVTGNRI